MQKLRKQIMKNTSKTFTLDPLLLSLKESAAPLIKKENWEIVATELKKFGIRLTA